VAARVGHRVLRGSVVALYVAAGSVFAAVLVSQLRAGTLSVEITSSLAGYADWDCRSIAPVSAKCTGCEHGDNGYTSWALNVFNVTRESCRAQLAATDPCVHTTACNRTAVTHLAWEIQGISHGAPRLVYPYEPESCGVRGWKRATLDPDSVAWWTSVVNDNGNDDGGNDDGGNDDGGNDDGGGYQPEEVLLDVSERARRMCLEDLDDICDQIPEVYPPYQCTRYVPTTWWQAVVAAFLTSYLALHSLVLLASFPLWYVRLRVTFYA
jgi:hypothetical protein